MTSAIVQSPVPLPALPSQQTGGDGLRGQTSFSNTLLSLENDFRQANDWTLHAQDSVNRAPSSLPSETFRPVHGAVAPMEAALPVAERLLSRSDEMTPIPGSRQQAPRDAFSTEPIAEGVTGLPSPNLHMMAVTEAPVGTSAALAVLMNDARRSQIRRSATWYSTAQQGVGLAIADPEVGPDILNDPIVMSWVSYAAGQGHSLTELTVNGQVVLQGERYGR